MTNYSTTHKSEVNTRFACSDLQANSDHMRVFVKERVLSFPFTELYFEKWHINWTNFSISEVQCCCEPNTGLPKISVPRTPTSKCNLDVKLDINFLQNLNCRATTDWLEKKQVVIVVVTSWDDIWFWWVILNSREQGRLSGKSPTSLLEIHSNCKKKI